MSEQFRGILDDSEIRFGQQIVTQSRRKKFTLDTHVQTVKSLKEDCDLKATPQVGDCQVQGPASSLGLIAKLWQNT